MKGNVELSGIESYLFTVMSREYICVTTSLLKCALFTKTSVDFIVKYGKI